MKIPILLSIIDRAQKRRFVKKMEKTENMQLIELFRENGYFDVTPDCYDDDHYPEYARKSKDKDHD